MATAGPKGLVEFIRGFGNRVMTLEHLSVAASHGSLNDIVARIVRIGFGGIIYYKNYNKEPPK